MFLAAGPSGDKDEFLQLLEAGLDINMTRYDGLSALHQACSSQHGPAIDDETPIRASFVHFVCDEATEKQHNAFGRLFSQALAVEIKGTELLVEMRNSSTSGDSSSINTPKQFIAAATCSLTNSSIYISAKPPFPQLTIIGSDNDKNAKRSANDHAGRNWKERKDEQVVKVERDITTSRLLMQLYIQLKYSGIHLHYN
uniref:ANK_REP_REGION domain-containing protein n=1 Tax=Glossina brevipalpis TaxID=37001 RepID=A0A1A9WZM8_9MUSC